MTLPVAGGAGDEGRLESRQVAEAPGRPLGQQHRQRIVTFVDLRRQGDRRVVGL